MSDGTPYLALGRVIGLLLGVTATKHHEAHTQDERTQCPCPQPHQSSAVTSGVRKLGDGCRRSCRRRGRCARGGRRCWGRRSGRGDLAALDLLLGQGASLVLGDRRDVDGVLDDLPGGSAHEHDLVGGRDLGAVLRHLGVTTHPLYDLPHGVGHLGFGDLGLAALDLLLRESAGARLGHRRDVGGVDDRDVLAVLDDDLVGRGGLGTRLRHFGVTTHPLGVLPVGVLDLGLGCRRRRVAAVARRRAVGRVRSLAGQRLVQEPRLVRVVGPVELGRHLQSVESALAHELGVDVVLTAGVECGSGVRERPDGVHQYVVVADQRLGPRGVPGRRTVVLERGGTHRERVTELVTLLGVLGAHRDRSRADAVEGVGPRRLLDTGRRRRGAADDAALPVVVGAVHLRPLDFVVRPTRPVGVLGDLVGHRLTVGVEVGVVEVEGLRLARGEVLDADVNILVVGPRRDVVRVDHRQAVARRCGVLPVPVERLFRLRTVGHARLGLPRVVRDRDGATLRIGEGPRERAREVLQRVDRDRDGVVPRLQTLVGTGSANVLTDEDLLRLIVTLGRGLRPRHLGVVHDDRFGHRLRLGCGVFLDRVPGGSIGRVDVVVVLSRSRASPFGGARDFADHGGIIIARGLARHGHRCTTQCECTDDANRERRPEGLSSAFTRLAAPTLCASCCRDVHNVPFGMWTSGGIYSVVESSN